MRRALAIGLLLSAAMTAPLFAQTGASLYHLGDRLIQSNFENPALMPTGKYFVGIPVLSGVRLNYINELSYDEAITTNEDGERELNIDKVISNLKDDTFIYSSGEATLAYLGVNTKKGAGINAYIKEKAFSSINLPKKVVEFAWYGNNYLGNETLSLDGLKSDNRYYREYGLGYMQPINSQWSIGGRFKIYQGLINASTDGDFQGSVQTDPQNFTLSFRLQNAELHTAGLDADQSYFFLNGNYGFGGDIGVDWSPNDKLNINAAVRDIGAIRWRSNTTTYGISDVDLDYRGVSFATVNDLIEEVQDSLLDKFQDFEEVKRFTTTMNTSLLINGSYRLWEEGAFHATMGNTIVLDKIRTMLSLGYVHDFSSAFSLSGTVTKLPQQFFNFGLAARVEAGPAQFYVGTDKVFGNYNLTSVEALNLRFGVNLIFGEQKGVDKGLSEKPTRVKAAKTKEKAFKPAKHADHPSRGNRAPKVKGRDGIYTLTSKQKKAKRPKHKRIKEGGNKGKNKRYKPKKAKKRKKRNK